MVSTPKLDLPDIPMKSLSKCTADKLKMSLYVQLDEHKYISCYWNRVTSHGFIMYL